MIQQPTAEPDVSRSFLDAVLAGAAHPEQIDDWIGSWHEGAGPGLTLAEHLGLARQEYAAWAECRTGEAETIELAKARRQAQTTILLDDDASPEPLLRNACKSGFGSPPTQPRPLLARLGPDCPTRPVDWRWLKAGLMLELGLRWSRRRDDEATRMARRYRAAWRRCRDDAGRQRLGARMPGIAGACAIRDGEPRVRWAVEARLLAGEAIDAVARKVGLRPEAVAWYERVFFHVTDRLGSRGYVVHEVIGPRLHRGLMAQDLDLLWKAFALSGGPEALDALIRSTWDAASGARRPGEAPSEVVSFPRADRPGDRRHGAALRPPGPIRGEGPPAPGRLGAALRREGRGAEGRRLATGGRRAARRRPGRARRLPWHQGDGGGGGGAGEGSRRQPVLMGEVCVRDRRPGHRGRASARRGAERGPGWAPPAPCRGSAGGPSRAAGLGSGTFSGLQWVGGDAADGAPGEM